MADKSWLLNAAAIRAAKRCIQCVEDELEVKLKLSHPEFMQMLHEYVELTDSVQLGEAYSELLSFVGVGDAVRNLRPKEQKVVELQPTKQVVNGASVQQEEEMVEYRGKHYPATKDGKRFTGLYRGQPHYR